VGYFWSIFSKNYLYIKIIYRWLMFRMNKFEGLISFFMIIMLAGFPNILLAESLPEHETYFFYHQNKQKKETPGEYLKEAEKILANAIFENLVNQNKTNRFEVGTSGMVTIKRDTPDVFNWNEQVASSYRANVPSVITNEYDMEVLSYTQFSRDEAKSVIERIVTQINNTFCNKSGEKPAPQENLRALVMALLVDIVFERKLSKRTFLLLVDNVESAVRLLLTCPLVLVS